MADNDAEREVRELIERWAHAVHVGDLETVVADHAEDIVMFDVPPPQDGIRGLADYTAAWPPFFEFQASGACFDIVELDVTAGADVAFAHALLRCDTPEAVAARPDLRLRLTLGLRREEGRWVVAHEHHSFPDESHIVEEDQQAVRDVHRKWAEDTAAGDLDALVAPIADDIVSYEHGGSAGVRRHRRRPRGLPGRARGVAGVGALGDPGPPGRRRRRHRRLLGDRPHHARPRRRAGALPRHPGLPSDERGLVDDPPAPVVPRLTHAASPISWSVFSPRSTALPDASPRRVREDHHDDRRTGGRTAAVLLIAAGCFGNRSIRDAQGRGAP